MAVRWAQSHVTLLAAFNVFVCSCFTVCDGGSLPSSPQCKRRFERDCKEADRAQQYFEKMDADINVTKADVEKVLLVPATALSPSHPSRAARVLTHPQSTPTTLLIVAAFSFCNLQNSYSVS